MNKKARIKQIEDDILKCIIPLSPEAVVQVTSEVTGEVRRLLQVLDLAPLTRVQAQSVLGLKGQANFRDRYLEPALESGLIEMTIRDKPRSSKQKYRLTDKGRTLLKEFEAS